MNLRIFILAAAATAGLITTVGSDVSISGPVNHNSGSPSMFIASDAWQKIPERNTSTKSKVLSSR